MVTLSDGQSARVCAFPVLPDKWQVRLGDRFVSVRRIVIQNPAERPRHRKLLAMVQGRVHAIFFRAGMKARAHEPILIVESLGLLVPHALPLDATLLDWNVETDDIVHGGQELASFELCNTEKQR